MIFESGKTCDLLPQREGFVVVGIDGGEQAVFGEAEILGDQFPSKCDGIFLEVVAEGEIAQHLEEGVMAGGVAHIVEVVVLAAGADAFLRGGGAAVGALFLTGEDVLELHHARIGEKERGVVARHERGGRHGRVAAGSEEIEEIRADVSEAFHGESL